MAGPTPGWNGIVSYFWHGSSNLGTWNRIIMGSAQGARAVYTRHSGARLIFSDRVLASTGLDNDISNFTPTGAPDNQLAAIYSQAMIYSLQMTSELLRKQSSSS